MERRRTGLTCPILRYNPAIIAQAAATVSSLAGGRTYLSVGTGEALNEYHVTWEWPEYDERQLRMIEAIELIRELWTGEKVSFDGVTTEPKRQNCTPYPKMTFRFTYLLLFLTVHILQAMGRSSYSRRRRP